MKTATHTDIHTLRILYIFTDHTFHFITLKKKTKKTKLFFSLHKLYVHANKHDVWLSWFFYLFIYLFIFFYAYGQTVHHARLL